MKKCKAVMNQEVPLVVIIDERGARCVDGIPRGLEGYTIEHGIREVIVCRKSTVLIEKENVAVVGAHASDAVADSVEEITPLRFVKIDQPVRPLNDDYDHHYYRNHHESRSHQQGKRQLPKRTESARFNLARQNERLAEMHIMS